jgi:hypothetical protein
MGKKWVWLCLLLSLAVLCGNSKLYAHAWVGPAPGLGGPGDWENPTNWNPASVPGSSQPDDDGVVLSKSDGSGASAQISSTVPDILRLDMKVGVMWLTINNGGSLDIDGSVEQSKGTSSVVTIMAGGTLNACQKLLSTVGTYKLGSASAGTDTVNIYGTLNVKDSLADSLFSVGAGSGLGTPTAKIYSTGFLDVDLYSINRGTIEIATGGLMKIKGDVTTQVNDDITAGNIAGMNGAHLNVWTTGGYTYVPEPATVAMLGLGSLMLLRRKR